MKIYPRRRNKYRVAPKEDRTWNGRVYASKAEMLYARDVLDMKRRNIKSFNYWHQPSYRLGCPENKYVADFCVQETPINSTAAVLYAVDVKGVETPVFRKNKRLWKVYGPYPLHIVKRQRNNRKGMSGFKTVEIIVPEPRKAK